MGDQIYWYAKRAADAHHQHRKPFHVGRTTCRHNELTESTGQRTFFLCSVAGACGELSAAPSMDREGLMGADCGGLGHLETALSAGPLGRDASGVRTLRQ